MRIMDGVSASQRFQLFQLMSGRLLLVALSWWDLVWFDALLVRMSTRLERQMVVLGKEWVR